MARIRTLKPEILEDAKTANLSHEAWRLFVSLIVLADDFGALRGSPALLHSQAFWASPLEDGQGGVTEALAELRAEGLVTLYEVRGQRYIQVTNWEKHQRVDNRGKPRVPRPEDDGAWIVPRNADDRVYFIQDVAGRAVKIGYSHNPERRLGQLQSARGSKLKLLVTIPGNRSDEHALHKRFAHLRLEGEWFREDAELMEHIETLSRESREGFANGSRDGVETSRLDPDQGSGIRTTTTDHDLPGSARPRESKAKSPVPAEHVEIAERVLTLLKKYSGVEYQTAWKGQPTKAVKLISNLLARGLSETDLRAITAYCGHETGKGWANKPEMAEYLRPETLYGPEKHESYLDPARAWHRKHFGEETANG